MPVLNQSTDEVFVGTQAAIAAYLGTVEIWTLAAPPVNTAAPVASGDTTPPADLACTTGAWSGSPTSYAYQWQEFTGGTWVDVSGQTASTYTDAPLGQYRCEVIATNAEDDSDPAYSNSIAVTSGVARVFGFNTVPPSDGGFPGSADRALASKFSKSHAGRITQINFRLRSDTEVGANGKITCHADDAGGTVPGTRLWISGSVAIPAGATIQTPALPSSGIEGTDAAGTYWLVFVPDNFQADIAKSNTLSEGQTVMANGTYSYASPPSSWPGTDGTYDGPVCVWCDYIG